MIFNAEQDLHTGEVVGSIPTAPTTFQAFSRHYSERIGTLGRGAELEWLPRSRRHFPNTANRIMRRHVRKFGRSVKANNPRLLGDAIATMDFVGDDLTGNDVLPARDAGKVCDIFNEALITTATNARAPSIGIASEYGMKRRCGNIGRVPCHDPGTEAITESSEVPQHDKRMSDRRNGDVGEVANRRRVQIEIENRTMQLQRLNLAPPSRPIML
jgi:hypothetical protein